MLKVFLFILTFAIQKNKTFFSYIQIKEIQKALDIYYCDNSCYPTSQQGLQCLFSPPVLKPFAENWNGPYLSSFYKRDPWGNTYVYSLSFDKKNYTITSLGKDCAKGGEGENKDISVSH